MHTPPHPEPTMRPRKRPRSRGIPERDVFAARVLARVLYKSGSRGGMPPTRADCAAACPGTRQARPPTEPLRALRALRGEILPRRGLCAAASAKRTRGARITCLSKIARRSRHTRATCRPSAATADPTASAALHSLGLLDVPQWVRLRRPSFVRLAPPAVYAVSRRMPAGRPGWDAPDEGFARPQGRPPIPQSG